MKTIHIIKLLIVGFMVAMLVLPVSCTKDLLDQKPTTEADQNLFWKTDDDALYALQGAYADIRPVFDRDYYFDGHGEYVRTRGTSVTTNNLRLGDAYQGGSYDNPSAYASAFDKMYRYLYGGVHRANYVIDNVQKMIPSAKATSVPSLEIIIAEARMLRGLCYFKLISMWGDVPYIGHTIYNNSEVASVSRLPIGQVKDSIMADLNHAATVLPVKPVAVGRVAKPAAIALRGKVQLYWASWNKFGWPELAGFTPDATAATAAYTAAAADFKSVTDDFGLLLFRNGEPGEIDAPGKAEKLPNYYYLFTPVANGDSEFVLAFAHGATGTNQGEELMRDFAGRSHEGSQVWVTPRFEIADRYQTLSTGEFAPPLVTVPPTTPNYFTLANSSLNPQSYVDRDYRMKSSIQWDYETSIGMTSLKSTGWCPFIYKTWNTTISASNYSTFPGFTAENIGQTTYNTDGTNSGYVFRKFVRNVPGDGRSNGNYNWPVIRLADVFLMYAEAINEVNDGPDQKSIDLLNMIRHRGNLLPLTADKTATKDAFFAAIEQERIVELLAEGHRGFDLRRWRAIERVWCPPYDNNGVWRKDTHGANQTRYFLNSTDRTYQQCYIFRIPPGERDKNPNLTQNTPWL